jgi:hypothetical protein
MLLLLLHLNLFLHVLHACGALVPLMFVRVWQSSVNTFSIVDVDACRFPTALQCRCVGLSRRNPGYNAASNEQHAYVRLQVSAYLSRRKSAWFSARSCKTGKCLYANVKTRNRARCHTVRQPGKTPRLHNTCTGDRYGNPESGSIRDT